MPQSRESIGRRWLTPLTIAAAYAAVGLVYIGLSDRAVSRLIRDPVIQSWVGTFKGWGYVLLTALLLWMLMRRMVAMRATEQAARQQADRRLRAILETEPECVKVVRADGVLVDINPAGLRMLEADSVQQVRGKNVLSVVTPEFRDGLAAMLRRVAAGAEREEAEFEIVALKGSRRRLQSTNVPLRGPDGSIEGVLALTRDVSERRRVEDAARAGEKMLSMLTDALPVFLSYVDAEERYRWVNRRYESWYGLPPEAIVGKKVAELQTPEAYSTIAPHLRRALAGERVQYSNDLTTPAGERLSFETLYEPRVEPDGTVIGCFVMVVDVTAPKRSEAALRRVEQRFREMAEATDEVFVFIDWREQRVTYASPAIDRMLGISADDLMRDISVGRRLVHPDDRGWLFPLLDRVRQTGEYEAEYRIVRTDGSERWLHSRMFPIRGEDGSIVRAVGITRDITDRKRAEAAQRESEARYRAVVQDQTELVCRFTPDGRITLANHAYARYFGREEREITRANMYDLILDAGERERLRGILGSITREAPVVSLVAKWRMADGQVRARHWVDRGIFNDQGELVEIQAVGRDITEQVRADEALRESEERFRLATRATFDAVWDWDPRTDRVKWGEGVTTLFGWDRLQMEGEQDGWSSRIHPEDKERILRQNRESLEPHGTRHWSDQYRFRKADGSWAVVLDRAYVVRDEEGRAVRVIGAMSDITDRDRAERALRESEARFRAIFELSAVGMARVSPQGRLLIVNAAFASLLGFAPEELEGRLFSTITHPNDVELNLHLLRQTVEGKRQSYSMEKRYIRKDGTAIWTSLSVAAVRAADGSVDHFISVVWDLSERKRAEEALRQSEATTRALLDAVPDMMFRMDRDGRYLAYHAPNQNDLALPPARFLGKTAREVLPRDRAEQCMNALDAVFRTGQTQLYEYRGDAGGGGTGVGGGRHWEVRAVRCGENEALLLVRDVTQRKQAEADLWHSQERTRLLVNQTPLGVIVWDLRFEVSEWNPGAEAIFGYPASEAVGRPADFIVPPSMLPHVRRVRQALLEHTGGTRSTNDNLTRDGRTIRCEWYNTPIVDAEGRSVGIASIVQDVTERERAAEALRASESRYRLLFESNLDALLLWDDSGVVTSANAAAADLLGRPIGAIAGRPFTEAIRTPLGIERLRRAVDAFGPDGVAAGELEVLRPEGSGWSTRTVEFAARRVMGEQTMIILQDVSHRREAERRQTMMMAELDHRVKNNLSAVLALAEQSVRASGSLEAFMPAFTGRIRAMSRMHTALAQGQWDGAPLRQLIRQSLEAYMLHPESADGSPGDRISLQGQDVVIPARAVSPLAMALHELATNAAKYGSLGPGGGHVSVEWRVDHEPGEVRRLSLRWIESGGPPVATPARRGFGTELIRGGIAYELQGSVTLEFPPQGARCQILMPLDETVPPHPNGVWAPRSGAAADRPE